eukprot:3566851-Pyramimonas_sp.AAC.1
MGPFTFLAFRGSNTRYGRKGRENVPGVRGPVLTSSSLFFRRGKEPLQTPSGPPLGRLRAPSRPPLGPF